MVQRGVWLQDSAPAHRAVATQKFLQEELGHLRIKHVSKAM